MEPFFSGMAIGLVLLILMVPLLLLFLIGCFFYGFFRAARASWVKAHPVAPHVDIDATRQGHP